MAFCLVVCILKENKMNEKTEKAISAILEFENRIEAAANMIIDYGGIDGGHHKQWVLDQTLRILLGDGYQQWLSNYCEDGRYEWDEGIAP
jgi:hypothetical protein